MYKLKDIMTDRALLETVNKVNTQYDVMPEASSLQGKVVQFVGENFEEFKTGYFYQSVETSENVWEWKVIVSGGGGSPEPVVITDASIPLDTETGMYIYMLPDEIGMVYVASGYIVDFESETGFVESEGNSALLAMLFDTSKVLKEFSIEVEGNTYFYGNDWTIMDIEGTLYFLNVENTLVTGTPEAISANISYSLGDKFTIDQVAGLPEALAANKPKDLFTTLLLEDWGGEPLANTCYFSEISEVSNPIVDIDTSEVISYEALKILREEFSKIYTAITAEGSITFYAGEELTISLPLKIKVV